MKSSNLFKLTKASPKSLNKRLLSISINISELEGQLIREVFKILEVAFAKNESVGLHELLWSIDAKHHLILNPDEINSAIELVGGIQKSTDGNVVKLSQPEAKKSDYIFDEDIEKAMKIYNDYLER